MSRVTCATGLQSVPRPVTGVVSWSPELMTLAPFVPDPHSSRTASESPLSPALASLNHCLFIQSSPHWQLGVSFSLTVVLVTQSCPTLVTPWTVARQAPLSMGFSRQEYWTGLPFPPPGNLPNPGIEPVSLASPALASGFFTTAPPGSPCMILESA